MSFSTIIDVVAALALTALVAESYGAVRRRLVGNVLAPFVLGVFFGLMALVVMFNPLEPFEGLIIDMRNIPIALAGAFLGWRGLLPCLAIAVATRVGLGGVGMEAGIWGMVIAGLAGLIWARKMASQDTRTFGALLLLGMAMSTHLLSGLALPREFAIWFFTTAAAPMLAMNLIAVPLIASLLEREIQRIRRDNRFAASATHDAMSGLLLAPAFMREMTNAYAARPFGTYAGFLTIDPALGLWRTAVRLFGEPVAVGLDRQALATVVEHAELAGVCSDGRILVPLSREEMQQVTRVKAALTVVLRNTPSAAAGMMVTLSVVETPTPDDFLRITITAPTAAKVDWKGQVEGRQQSLMRPDEPSRVRRASLFNPEEHDILFAKAEFLIKRKNEYAP